MREFNWSTFGYLVFAGFVLFAAACSRSENMSFSDLGVEPEPVSGIGMETLMDAIQMLASDDFEGRAPGSLGEAKTVDYLKEKFEELGLEPGNPNGQWVQPVPLVGLTPQAGNSLTV